MSHLQAQLRVSESQRSTLEVSVLQTTETISALSNQITELESLKNAEASRASSLEVKLSLEADARVRAEELAVEAVRWKDERVQYQWEGNGANKSLEHDDASELHSLRKMVLHLESRITDKNSAREGERQPLVASLQRQLDSYQEQAKQWETLRQKVLPPCASSCHVPPLYDFSAAAPSAKLEPPHALRVRAKARLSNMLEHIQIPHNEFPGRNPEICARCAALRRVHGHGRV